MVCGEGKAVSSIDVVRRGTRTAAALFLALTASLVHAESYRRMAPVEQYLMADRQAEIDLARSAAPGSISEHATVLVFTDKGYETAVEGTNGFVCLVARSWQRPFSDPEFWNPTLREPTCYNAAAAQSVLRIDHNRTTLALARLSKQEIAARVSSAISRKDQPPPAPGSMSYKMSREQYLGDQLRHWQPHLMFYAPGATTKSKQWGANLPNSPLLASPERLPDGRREPVIAFMVPVGAWSDGTNVSQGNP